jgi:hypothetical protein
MPPPPSAAGEWSAPVDFPVPNPTLNDGLGHTLVDNRGLFVLHAVVLKTGKVLCFCGHVEASFYAPKSYLFDPNNPTTQLVPIDFPTGMDLFCCHYVTIPDGRVLVVGGSDTDFSHHGSVGAKNVAIFDPDTSLWSEAMVGGNPVRLLQGRWYPTAVLLPDGRVFVASGRPEHNGGTIADKVEILTPPNWDTTELSGATMQLPIYPGLHLAPNGKIYFTHTTWGQEIVDPETMAIEVTTGSTSASWTTFAGNRPAQPRREEGMSVLLPPAQAGKILLIGGSQAENAAGVPIMNGGTPAGAAPPSAFAKIHATTDPFSAEILDTTVNPPTWSAAPGAPMAFGRTNGHCVILPDATVLICGGHDSYKWKSTSFVPPTNPSLTAEIFKPGSGFTQVAAMARPRMYHSVALLLRDGRVMTAGGADANRSEPVLPWPAGWDPARKYGAGMAINDKSFEFYKPPYFFNGARPTIQDITINGTSTRQIDYGKPFKIKTAQAATIDKVALTRPNAPTHHTDSEQRYVALTFTRGTNELDVTMVNDAKIAPPGFYMLWIVATGSPNGLPCELAEFINIPAPPLPARPHCGCLVATATLGSPDHPSVIQLTALREDIAATSALGRGFIAIVNRVYASFSPQLAGYLEQRPVPRRAVRDCVVRPVAAIVAATERATRRLPPRPRNAARVGLLAIEGVLGVIALPLFATAVAVRAAIGAARGARDA